MSSSKNERVAVYIDGGNTYRKLKALGIPEKKKRFDYNAFVNHLIGNREIISKRYYVGIVKNFDKSEKGEYMVKSQQRFLEGLRSDSFEIKAGKIMYDDCVLILLRLRLERLCMMMRIA